MSKLLRDPEYWQTPNHDQLAPGHALMPNKDWGMPNFKPHTNNIAPSKIWEYADTNLSCKYEVQEGAVRFDYKECFRALARSTPPLIPYHPGRRLDLVGFFEEHSGQNGKPKFKIGRPADYYIDETGPGPLFRLGVVEQTLRTAGALNKNRKFMAVELIAEFDDMFGTSWDPENSKSHPSRMAEEWSEQNLSESADNAISRLLNPLYGSGNNIHKPSAPLIQEIASLLVRKALRYRNADLSLASVRDATNDLLYTDLNTEDAPERLEQWVLTGVFSKPEGINPHYAYQHHGEQETALSRFIVDDDKDRVDFLKDLNGWIRSENDSDSMLRNVYSEFSWSGLNALGNQLYTQFQEGEFCPQGPQGLLRPRTTEDAPGETEDKDERVNVYVDYTQPPREGASHFGVPCLRYIYIPVGTDGRGRSRYSYGEVLGLLKNFVEGKSPDEPPRRISSADERVMVLNQIRESLAKHPALIVFGGYSERPTAGYQIQRICRGDFLIPTLIPNLLEPPTLAEMDPSVFHNWRKNRILVLSDRPLDNSLSDDTVDKGIGLCVQRYRNIDAFSPKRIALPRLPVGRLPEVLKSHCFLRHDEAIAIATLLKLPPGFQKETQMRCLSILAHIASLSQRRDKPEFGADQKIVNDISNAILRHRRVIRAGANDILHAGSRELLLQLKSYNPTWFLCLQFIALTPGGIRKSVLSRMVKRFVEANRGDPINGLSADLVDENIAALEAGLGEMICSGRREEFAIGPDYFRLPNTGPEDVEALEFSLPALRDAILQQMHEYKNGAQLALELKLILCDESYRQHSASVTSQKAASGLQLDHYRRLVQVIYHGLDAVGTLHFDESSDEYEFLRSRLDASKLIIPNDPVRLWAHLFRHCYYEELEDRQEFRLSRSLARNQLKHELLLAFSRPWVLSPVNYSGVQDWFEFTQQRKESGLEAEAWQALQDQIAIASAQAQSVLFIDGDLGLRPTTAALLKIEKHRLRSEIARDHEGSALVRAEELLKKHFPSNHRITSAAVDQTEPHACAAPLGPEPGSFEELDSLISTAGLACEKIVNGQRPMHPHYRYVTFTAGELERLVRSKDGQECRIIVDALNRRAEAISTRAELARGDAQTTELRPAAEQGGKRRKPASALRELEPDEQQKFITDACLAFANFEAAEIIRHFSFERFPHLGTSMVSGPPTRAAIRTALVLEREARNLDTARYLSAGIPGAFGQYADQMSGLLERHLSRFPSEKIGILILKATGLRHLCERGSPEYAKNLEDAFEYLRFAELLLMNTSPTSTTRIRFLNERQKCYRSMIDVVKTKREKNALACFARHDINSMANLAGVLHLRLWSKIAMIQSIKLDRAKEKHHLGTTRPAQGDA